MKQKAPISAPTLTGAGIRTAEAAQTFQVHYPASGCALQGDFSRDVPLMLIEPCEQLLTTPTL
jgi:hypothetical protein